MSLQCVVPPAAPAKAVVQPAATKKPAAKSAFDDDEDGILFNVEMR